MKLLHLNKWESYTTHNHDIRKWVGQSGSPYLWWKMEIVPIVRSLSSWLPLWNETGPLSHLSAPETHGPFHLSIPLAALLTHYPLNSLKTVVNCLLLMNNVHKLLGPYWRKIILILLWTTDQSNSPFIVHIMVPIQLNNYLDNFLHRHFIENILIKAEVCWIYYHSYLCDNTHILVRFIIMYSWVLQRYFFLNA